MQFTPEVINTVDDVLSSPLRNNFNKLQTLLNAGLGNDQFADGALSMVKTDFLSSASVGNMLLGYAQSVVAQTGIGSTTDLTSLSVSVTVPAGGRSIRITGYVSYDPSGGPIYTHCYIFEGATQKQRSSICAINAHGYLMHHPSVVLTPTAGAHTYKLRGSIEGGATFDTRAGNESPDYILVELI